MVPPCGPSEFRSIVISRHLAGQPGREIACSLYPLFSNGTECLYDFLQKMLQTPHIASDFEMELIAMQFGINVVSFSNDINGIIVFDSVDFITNKTRGCENLAQQLPPTPEIAYVYHHQYRRHLTARPSSFLNKLCPLMLTETSCVQSFSHSEVGVVDLSLE